MRLISLVLVLLLVVLQGRLWLGEGGLRDYFKLRAAVDAASKENAQLHDRNAELAAEVFNLKTGYAAVEERARSELGMIGTGETFYQFVDRR